jgi:hypothetical protein
MTASPEQPSSSQLRFGAIASQRRQLVSNNRKRDRQVHRQDARGQIAARGPNDERIQERRFNMDKLLIALALTAALATPALAARGKTDAIPEYRQVQSMSAQGDRAMQGRFARGEHTHLWQSCPDPDHIWDARCY